MGGKEEGLGEGSNSGSRRIYAGGQTCNKAGQLAARTFHHGKRTRQPRQSRAAYRALTHVQGQ